jgi:hypothetical protein
VQRYCDVPLPHWRYVPGRGPHPRHRTGPHLPPLPAPAADAAPFDERTWPRSTAYLYAIDLFNHRYLWEAHEALEGLISELDRGSTTRRFLTGLVQLSAAMLKPAPAQHAGALRLMARALQGLESAPPLFLGVDVAKLVSDVRAVASGQRSTPPRIDLQLGADADLPAR